MRNTRSHKFHHCDDGKVVEAAAEKDFVSSIKEATEVPRSSFQFYVWSDEGINLQVELNSSQSDWTDRFKNEVRISDSVNGNKSWSLRQCLSGLVENSTRDKSSFLWNTSSGQIDDHDGQAKSFSNLKLTKDGVAQLNKHNKGDRPLISNSLTPYSITVKVANSLQENQSAVSAELTENAIDNLMQDQSTVSAEVSYGARKHSISGTESFAKDASKKVIASDATNTPFKSLRDSVRNSLSDPGTPELQNSKPENECSEDCALPNGSCIVNPRVVLGLQVVARCHKYSAVSHCDNGGSLDLSDPKITSDTKQGSVVNFTSITEEGEAAKTVNGRVSSECSPFGDPIKKSCRVSDDQVSRTEFHKKRKNKEFEIQDSSDKSAARILRSMAKTKTVHGRESSECSQLDDPVKKPSQDSDDQVSKTELRQNRRNKEFDIQYSSDKFAARILRSMTKTKAVDGRESLECPQFGDPLKKSSRDSDDQVSKTELHKKRKNREFEIQDSSDKPAARVLRSMMKTKIVVGRESSECSQFGGLKKSSQDSDDRVSEMELHRKRENKEFEIQDSSDKPAARILRSMTKTKTVVDGRESSECPQFGDPLKKSSRDSDDQVSKTELHKKRENEEFEIQDSSDKPAARVLRSMTKAKTVDGRESSECPQFGDPLKKSTRDSNDWVSKTELHKKRENEEFEIQGSRDKLAARVLRSMTKTKTVDGRQSSECSQFGDTLEKSCQDSDDQVSKTELHKKRENEDFEIQVSSDKTATRVLRSMTKKKTVDGRESSECPQFDDPLKKSSRDSNDQASKTELHKKRENEEFEIQGSSDKPAPRVLRSLTKTNTVDGRDSSECSLFGDTLKKSSQDSDDQASKTELHKEMENEEFEIQDSRDPAARILRSMTKTTVTVLPRRSMRLIS